jgi:hypothetical protein
MPNFYGWPTGLKKVNTTHSKIMQQELVNLSLTAWHKFGENLPLVKNP